MRAGRGGKKTEVAPNRTRVERTVTGIVWEVICKQAAAAR